MADLYTTDGRTERATGRTEQFNIRCRPEFKQAVAEAADAQGKLMVEVIEEAFALWQAQRTMGHPNDFTSKPADDGAVIFEHDGQLYRVQMNFWSRIDAQ